jgi:hypothetical protein
MIMKVKILSLILLLLASLPLCAQESGDATASQAEQKIRYALIFEGGLTTASPVSICGEFVMMHGIFINKRHVVALASGIAGGFAKQYGKDVDADPFYIPIYAHYRYYVNQNKRFTPIIAASLGGLISLPQEREHYSGPDLYVYPAIYTEYGKGFYSEIAAGFKAGIFFLIGGVNFTPMYTTVLQEKKEIITGYDYWGNYVERARYTTVVDNKWIFPLGLCLKIGVSF